MNGSALPFFFSSRRRHTSSLCDWSSDVCSSDLDLGHARAPPVSRSPQALVGRCTREILATARPQRESARSEEHTSELQSHSDLVCRLLLEKKKRKRK